MKFQLNIGVESLAIYESYKLLEIIPAYIFLGENNNTIFGKEAYRAIDLYPENIYSLNNAISEQSAEKLEKLITVMDNYIQKKYGIEDYETSFNIYPDRLLVETLKKIIKGNVNSTVMSKKLYVMNDGVSKLLTESKSKQNIIGSRRLVKYFDNTLADNLTSYVLNKYGKLSAAYFNKIKTRIYSDIEVYKEKLFCDGEVNIQLKIVDENLIIHKISCDPKKEEICEDKLTSLFQDVNKASEKSVKENFEYNLCDKYFKVSLISPFSNGKSTILNSIVGDSLLNMDIRAETAVITKISCSVINKVYIKYGEGKIETFDYKDVEELKNIISLHTSVRSGKSLPEEVHILYKLHNLQGVTLIDSPGLFSPHKDHNAIAEKALEISDLVLFVVNPGRIGEKNFTEKIKQYVEYIRKNNKKFGFILSKYDLYEPEKESVFEEFNEVLTKLQLEGSETFFLSGYFALMGRLLGEDKINIDTIRKSRDIYVIQEEDFITGRNIMEEHYKALIEFSNIESLENYIMNRGVRLENS
jgi:GTPase Era involved in 16S rRNA processing